MIGLNHALESSSSSDQNDDEDEDNEYENNVFIKHLRKGFISFDENSYCENGILPELKIFNKKTPEFVLFYIFLIKVLCKFSIILSKT